MPWFDLADYDVRLPDGSASAGWSISPAGDLDADGFEDLLAYVNSVDESGPELLLVRGGATGPAVSTWSIPSRGLMDQSLWWAGGVGDLDGDGRGEIGVAASYAWLVDEEIQSAVYDEVYSGAELGGSATWAFETQAGMFDPALGIPALAGLGDLDGDGHPEPGMGLASRDLVQIYNGGPTGPGEEYTFFHAEVAGVPTGVDFGAALGPAGDIDGDGHDDLWIAAEDEVRVYLGGADVPTAAWSLPSTVAYTESAWTAGLGDLDADGYCDVGVVLDDAFTVVFGDGDASGVRRQDVPAAATEASAFVSGPGLDVNGDGYPDVLLLDHRRGASLRGELTLWVGTPSGLQEAASYIDELTDPHAAAADIDGDGMDDVVVATSETDGAHLRVYLGRTDLAPSTTPAFLDADADGYGDPALRRMTAGQEGWVADGTDCDDTNAEVHPGAPDPADDGRDADCDGFDGPPDTGTLPDTGDPTDTAETGDTAGDQDTGDTGSLPDSGDAPDPPSGGCGCSTAGENAHAGLVMALTMLLWRRRRAGRPVTDPRCPSSAAGTTS